MNLVAAWLPRLCLSLLSLAILADGSMYLYIKHAAPRPEGTTELHGSAWQTGMMPAPDGYDSKGNKVETPFTTTGWVVRYSSPSCTYCKADDPAWNQLATSLRKKGYGVLVVVPAAKDEYPTADLLPLGVQQTSYLSLNWIKRLKLTKTPTVMIFHPSNGLVWAHQGTLSSNDLSSALTTAGKLAPSS